MPVVRRHPHQSHSENRQARPYPWKPTMEHLARLYDPALSAAISAGATPSLDARLLLIQVPVPILCVLLDPALGQQEGRHLAEGAKSVPAWGELALLHGATRTPRARPSGSRPLAPPAQPVHARHFRSALHPRSPRRSQPDSQKSREATLSFQAQTLPSRTGNRSWSRCIVRLGR